MSLVLALLSACSSDPSALNGAAGSRSQPPAPVLPGIGWVPSASAPLALAGAGGPPPSRCPPEDPACIDVATVAPSWTTAAGWQLTNVELCGDVNGDGRVDAEGSFQSDTGELASAVVFGPLRRPLTLPDDADVRVTGGSCLHVLDVTGDGLLDYVCANPREIFGDPRLPDVVIPGPLAGTIDLPTDPRVVELGVVADRYFDWNGDGTIDAHVNLHRAGVVVGETWLGDWTTWGRVPPEVSLTWSCASDPDLVDPLASRTDDMDGDGVDELWLAGSISWDDDCAGFGIPATATGVIDVPTFPASIPGEGGAWHGDMDGDGNGEWWFPGSSVEPDRYLTGPVTFVDGQTTSATEVVPHASFGPRVGPTWVDLNGDGIGEYGAGWMDELHDATTVYFTGGATGGLATGLVLVTILSDSDNPGPSEWFVEDGAALAFALTDIRVQPAGVRIFEIAPTGAATIARR